MKLVNVALFGGFEFALVHARHSLPVGFANKLLAPDRGDDTAAAALITELRCQLARAFIYAQARTVLVSHCEVYSDATVKLITITVRDPTVGRAEAMRRSVALIDKGKPQEAPPAYWAPFVVVGEGAAVR